MEAAEDFVDKWTFEEFAADLKTQFAVIRALEIMLATLNLKSGYFQNISQIRIDRAYRPLNYLPASNHYLISRYLLLMEIYNKRIIGSRLHIVLKKEMHMAAKAMVT